MGDSSKRIDNLRYIYFTGENGSISNGPRCHICMNQAFRTNGIDAIEQVFVLTLGGLVPFLIRSLVFLYGIDTPFSLRDISEPHLVTECVNCSVRQAVSSNEKANLCGSVQEIHQELSKTRNDPENDIPSYQCHAGGGFLEDVSTATETDVSTRSLSNMNVMRAEMDSNPHSEAASPFTASEKKRKIHSDGAVAESKRVKTETEEELSPANIPPGEHYQAPTADIKNETVNIIGNRGVSTPLAVPDSEQSVIEPSSKAHKAKRSDESPRGNETCIPSPPIVSADFNIDFSASTSERIAEQHNKCFPLLRGRNPTTVTDPIHSWADIQGYISYLKKENSDDKLLRDHILHTYFQNEKTINCLACNSTVYLRSQGFAHVLSNNHWNSVKKRNEVFSMFMDLRKLYELLSEAKLELMNRTGKKYQTKRAEQLFLDIPDPSAALQTTTQCSSPREKPCVVEIAPTQNALKTGVLSAKERGDTHPGGIKNTKRIARGPKTLPTSRSNVDCQRVTSAVLQKVNESNIIKSRSLDIQHPQQRFHSDDLQNVNESSICRSLDVEHPQPQPLMSIPLSLKQPSVVEGTPIPSEKKFPFLTGRCPSSVSDPIRSLYKFNFLLTPLRDMFHGDNELFELILKNHCFKTEKIFCSVCKFYVSIRGGFTHFLGKRHFESVTSQNKVFSISRDLHKFQQMTKDTLSNRRRKNKHDDANNAETSNSTLNVTPGNKERNVHDATYLMEDNAIDFPFLLGRKHEDVQRPQYFTHAMQRELNEIACEAQLNEKIRSFIRQKYFPHKDFHFCEYCQENINTYHVLIHSLSSYHLQNVIGTGEVFCKTRDHDQVFTLFAAMKGKLNERSLSPNSLLPFGYGEPRGGHLPFESFENIFNFLTALKMSGKFDDGFNDFLTEKYSDVADINQCPHCGPIDRDNFAAVSHFLSLSHIVKAMELGQVFINDFLILKNLFRSYLEKSNCQEVDSALNQVEEAITYEVYSQGSIEFARLSGQILEANKMRNTFHFG